MDPNATIIEIDSALVDSDYSYAAQLASDLYEWLAVGGFAPSNVSQYPRVQRYLRRWRTRRAA